MTGTLLHAFQGLARRKNKLPAGDGIVTLLFVPSSEMGKLLGLQFVVARFEFCSNLKPVETEGQKRTTAWPLNCTFSGMGAERRLNAKSAPSPALPPLKVVAHKLPSDSTNPAQGLAPSKLVLVLGSSALKL